VATLTGCYRPLIFTEAAIYPTPVLATRNDFNWSYALFNQFASSLEYSFRLDFSQFSTTYLSSAIRMSVGGTTYNYGTWPITGTGFAESGTLDATWSNRLKTILFNRDFDVSNKAVSTDRLILRKPFVSGDSDVNLTITIKSKMNYRVNIGSLILGSGITIGTSLDNFAMNMKFYSDLNIELQNAILWNTTTMATETRKFDFGTILTDVNRFEIITSLTDIPPGGTTSPEVILFEFNLFSLTEVFVEDGETDDLWGWKYEVVEWWNILGHFKNIGWWLINQSPISPVFKWLNDYVLVWVFGFFDILGDIFL
jgi:hypothetical protein